MDGISLTLYNYTDLFLQFSGRGDKLRRRHYTLYKMSGRPTGPGFPANHIYRWVGSQERVPGAQIFLQFGIQIRKSGIRILERSLDPHRDTDPSELVPLGE